MKTAFGSMIETAIAATGRFDVIERRRMEVMMDEQARQRSGVVRSTAGRGNVQIGGLRAVDFAIYGTIASTGYQQKSDTEAAIGRTAIGMLLGNNNVASCSRMVATIAIDLRITEHKTGLLRKVGRVNHQSEGQTSCGGQSSINVPELLRGASNAIAANLVSAVFPITVALVDTDGSVVLNAGEGAIERGQFLRLFSKGASIPDPVTGEMMTNERPVGLIEVTEVTPRMSRAVVRASIGGGTVAVGHTGQQVGEKEVREMLAKEKERAKQAERDRRRQRN